jgi:drug/metabolite transporter (DMT)-like permease
VSRRGWLLFAAMCVIWGVPYLFIKVAVEYLSPVLLVFLRTAGGAALMLPVAAARGQLRPVLAHWRILLVYSAVEIAIPWLLLSDAETRLSSSLTGLLIAAVPLVGAVLTTVSGDDERLSTGRLVGLLVGVVGVAALLGFDVNGGDLGAVAEMAVVVVGYAIGPILIKRRLNTLPSMGVIASSLGVSALAYLPWAMASLPAAAPPARVVGSIAVLTVVCTAVAFLVFFALIVEVGPARATVFTYINPAVAVLLGVTVLSEPFTTGKAVGLPLVLAGSYLATRRTAAPPRQADVPEACAAATAYGEPALAPQSSGTVPDR